MQYAGTNHFQIAVYGNLAESGNTFTFKYYSASNDAVVELTETITFAPPASVGDVTAPLMLHGSSTVDVVLSLATGWNWISINAVTGNDSLPSLLGPLGVGAEYITSQYDGFATYYDDYGWYGSLVGLDVEAMYMLQMKNDDDLVVTGMAVDVASTPISLFEGCNWIGYLPQIHDTLHHALSSVGDDATYITSQYDGF